MNNQEIVDNILQRIPCKGRQTICVISSMFMLLLPWLIPHVTSDLQLFSGGLLTLCTLVTGSVWMSNMTSDEDKKVLSIAKRAIDE